MIKIVYAALAVLALCGSVLAQGGMGPGPGTAHSTGAAGWCGSIPQTNLVNCWFLNNASSVSDTIGGKTATGANVTLVGSGPTATLTNSAQFNATSAKYDTTLANLPATAFSLVIWVNDPAASSGHRIIANQNTDTGGPFSGFQVRKDNAITMTLYVGNGTVAPNVVSNSLSANTWTMLTWTWDGTTITGYQGASATGTTVGFTGTISNPGVNVGFGYNPAYNGDFYGGKIAGIAIYSTALSAGQVTTINGL